MNANVKEIIKIFKDKGNYRFLIASHQNLEGDAIGSQLALSKLLKNLDKKVILRAPEKIPQAYKFLPDAKMIKFEIGKRELDYDVACVLDCTGIDRMGEIKRLIDYKKPIINIDHHISNTYFGTINWVDPKASCTGEQVYNLFKQMQIGIDKDAALYIYITILTDTGSFRYSNTTSKSHMIAAELVAKGLNPTAVYRRIYEGTRRSHLALLSSVLATLDISKDGKIAWIRITEDMLKRYRSDAETVQDFVNFPRSIKGVKIAMAFREAGSDIIKVSFRSNEGVDVCRLAKLFGGGGHTSASGCILKGTLAEAEEAALLKAKRYLANS